MKKELFILLVLFCSTYQVNAQLNSSYSITDLYMKENLLINDTSFVSVIEIPMLSFDFSIHSYPSLSAFLTQKSNAFLIDFNAYQNSFEDASHHLFSLENNLFYYAFSRHNYIYFFGFNHHSFAEFSLSKELVSLLIDGNYQYLNQNIILNENNYSHAFNYLSMYFGFTKNINNDFLLSSKFHLLKGLNLGGVNLQGANLLFSDNFGTHQNPFLLEIDSKGTYFTNSHNSIFSNLGVAADLYLHYDYNEAINVYAQISHLGFILWDQDNYISDGVVTFDGLDYSLDDMLSTEYNHLQDSLIDIFDLDSINKNSLRLLPFDINLGIKYSFNPGISELNLNYNITKLQNNYLHTAEIAYLQYIKKYNFSVIPSYSISKFTYTNFAILFHKKWKNRFITNLQFGNLLDFMSIDSKGQRIVIGCDFYILF